MTMDVVATSYLAAATEAMPQVDVEVSFLSDALDGPVFRSVASDTTGGSTRRGRNRFEDRFTTGTCSIAFDERTRKYDPSNVSSPHYPNVVPNRRMRVLARYNSITYVVFDGYVDAWPLQNDGSGRFAVTCSDGFKILAASRLPAGNMPWNLEVIADKPVVWHKLGDYSAGGTMADSSGNGYSGVYTNGGASIAGLVAESSDAAVDFDGVDDYAQGGINFSVDSVLSGVNLNGAVEFWFRTSQSPSASTEAMMVVLSTSTRSVIALCSIGSTGRLLAVGTGSDAAVNDGLIHHAVLTAPGTSSYSLYVDGVLQSGGASAHASAPPPGVWLCRATDTGSAVPVPFDGTIDEVVVYDRPLSAARVLAHYNAGKAGTSGAWGGDASGARVTRYLDLVKYPALARDLDTGNSTLQPQGELSGDVLSALQTLADTEQGQFYMGIDGTMSDKHTFDLVWRQRHALINASQSARSTTSQATFRDRTTSSGYPYESVTFSTSDELILNDVTYTRNGGTPQRVTDADSQRRYGFLSDTVTGEWASDNDARDLANYTLARHKSANYRVTSVTIDPLNDPTNMFPLVLGLEIGSRITIKWTPFGANSEVSQESIIEGVEHSWSADPQQWKTTYRTSPAETTQFWILGDSTLGVLGTTTRLAA